MKNAFFSIHLEAILTTTTNQFIQEKHFFYNLYLCESEAGGLGPILIQDGIGEEMGNLHISSVPYLDGVIHRGTKHSLQTIVL